MKKSALILLIVLSPLILAAQGPYQLKKESKVVVTGTSSIHDWDMVMEKVTGSAVFIVDQNKLKEVKNLKIQMEAEDLKSGKGSMDKNAYNAMKTDDHKYILFELNDIKSVRPNGSGYKVTATGILSLAGVTKAIEVDALCSLNGSAVTCSGKHDLKMTEFNIDPPTAMFGSIKTGDAITIDFNVTFAN